jgi:hypothetical protein
MQMRSLSVNLFRANLAPLIFCVAVAALPAWSYAASMQLPETGFDLQAGQASQVGQAIQQGKQKSKKGKPSSNVPDPNAIKPAASIPIGPLGFAPPAAYYLGQRYSQASLGFLDENNLLFTFRVPGLIPREPGHASDASERHIRALTIAIPTRKVVAEGLWSVHDYSQYLWMLGDGKFLLRDRNLVQVGDASLHLEPFLRFPGPVHLLELDPREQVLVTNTSEPPAPEEKSPQTRSEKHNSAGAAHPDADHDANHDANQNANHDANSGANSSAPEVPTPATAAAAVVANSGSQQRVSTGSNVVAGSSTFTFDSPKPPDQNLVRILSLADRKVLLFSRTNGSVHIPVDGDGYYESLRGNDNKWMISFEFFTGQTAPLVWVDSTCDPALEAVAHDLVLASACIGNGARRLTAILRDRDKEHTRLWEATLPATKIWPLIGRSADGLRVARATLDVTHPVNAYNPLDDSDIRGQSVQVYDLATGQLALTVPANPILDAGGNFALSPSGKRLAVLNNGNIDVYDLAAPPPIPTTAPIR